ncbi:hypothetical protein V6M93_21785 [Pectobacterium brasiliense]|uniref:hypothetical protein n=1 Tax=Pectobacterium brasiliense TaxID=180957 RepID=UPI003670B870
MRALPASPAGRYRFEKTVGESYNALIQAGGTITADVKQDISNTTLQPGSGGFMPATTKPVLDAITTLSPLQKQTTRQLVSQDSSFNAGAVDVTKAGNGPATLAGNAADVNAAGKTVTLTQQAGTALQAGAQADNITTAIAAPTATGPLTLNTGDAVVLPPSASGHISNPDAVTLTPQSGTALQTGAQADNITATITTPNTAGPLTLNTGDAVVLQPSTSGHVSNPDAVALTSTGQRPDTGKSLTPVNVDNTATAVTVAGTVGTPATLATPGMAAIDAPKPTVSADTLGSLQALTLTTDGASFDNRGTVSGINTLSLFLTGHLDNAGTLQGNQLRAEAAQLTNQGTFHSTDVLTLAITGNLSNQGELLSDGDSSTTAQRFDNQGTLQAKNVALQVDELDNAGKILGVSSLALTATQGLTNRQTGKLLSQGAAVLTAAEGVNSGEWQAKALTLTANNLTNDGQIQGDDALSLTLPATDGKGTLINRGTLTTGGDATLFARLMENQGTLSSLGHTELTAVSLMNDGRVVAATGLSLRGDYQGRGLLNTAGTLTLQLPLKSAPRPIRPR